MTEKTLVAQASSRRDNQELLLKYFFTEEPLSTCDGNLPGIEIHAEAEGVLVDSSDIQLSLRAENVMGLIRSLAERRILPRDLETEIIRWSFAVETMCS